MSSWIVDLLCIILKITLLCSSLVVDIHSRQQKLGVSEQSEFRSKTSEHQEKAQRTRVFQNCLFQICVQGCLVRLYLPTEQGKVQVHAIGWSQKSHEFIRGDLLFKSFYDREKTPPDAKSFPFSTSALLHPLGEGKERWMELRMLFRCSFQISNKTFASSAVISSIIYCPSRSLKMFIL